MAVDRGRGANVGADPVRETGRGFPPRGCVRPTLRENGNIPAAMGGIPWPLVAEKADRIVPWAYAMIHNLTEGFL